MPLIVVLCAAVILASAVAMLAAGEVLSALGMIALAIAGTSAALWVVREGRVLR